MQICDLHIWWGQILQDSDLQSILANNLLGIRTSKQLLVVSFYVNPLFRPSFWCAELAPAVLKANTGSMPCPTRHATLPWCKEITYQYISDPCCHAACSIFRCTHLHSTPYFQSAIQHWDTQTCCAWLGPCIAWPCIMQPGKKEDSREWWTSLTYNPLETRWSLHIIIGILQDVAGAPFLLSFHRKGQKENASISKLSLNESLSLLQNIVSFWTCQVTDVALCLQVASFAPKEPGKNNTEPWSIS